MNLSGSILDKLEDILISKGRYHSREELIEDSFRSLLRAKPELRKELAIGLYERGEVSLSKAAEICGLNIEDFKELLRENGIKIVVPDISSEELDKEVEEISIQTCPIA